MTRIGKRAFIYALLFTFLLISMMDRINMSVAGSSVAAEMHLSPVALGYLFSSFLWIYIICLLPAGALTDRLGTRRTIGAAVACWSVFQMLSGLAPTMMTLLFSRLRLGVFESPTNPGANRVIREWAPRSERGLASAITGSFTLPFIVCGVLAMLGAVLAFVMTRGVIGAEDSASLPLPVGSTG